MRALRYIAGLIVSAAAIQSIHAANDAGFRFFENEVRPLLIKHCHECHSEESGKKKGWSLFGWGKK